MDDFEVKIVRLFNRLGSKKLDVFLAFINSVSFLVFFWTALTAVAIWKHPEIFRPFVEAVILVAVLHFGITEGIIKHLLTHFFPKRKRPYDKYPEMIKPVGRKFSDASFPSSHMTTTMAMLFVITSFYPSLIVPAVIFVLVMAFSRLHNGMHYPSDILAGIFLGSGYGWVALTALKVIL